MITVDLSQTTEVFTYYYNADKDTFGSLDQRSNVNDFTPTHCIIVDDTLHAQEIDLIFKELFN